MVRLSVNMPMDVAESGDVVTVTVESGTGGQAVVELQKVMDAVAKARDNGRLTVPDAPRE